MNNDYVPEDLGYQAGAEAAGEAMEEAEYYQTADGRIVDQFGNEYPELVPETPSESQELLRVATDPKFNPYLRRMAEQREAEPVEEIPQEPESKFEETLTDELLNNPPEEEE